LRAGRTKAVFPERDVRFLHSGEIGIDFCDFGIALTGSHGSVFRRAVNLVLPILSIALYVGCSCHDEIFRRCE
jgi:hypothetical protein